MNELSPYGTVYKYQKLYVDQPSIMVWSGINFSHLRLLRLLLMKLRDSEMQLKLCATQCTVMTVMYMDPIRSY